MKRHSHKLERIQSAVIRALWSNEINSVPSKEDFLQRFAPELLKGYTPNIPMGGIRTNGRGRCVNWSKPSIAKAQNTKRAKEAEEIFAACVAIIQSELERNKAK